jgi:hypothetical protein
VPQLHSGHYRTGDCTCLIRTGVVCAGSFINACMIHSCINPAIPREGITPADSCPSRCNADTRKFGKISETLKLQRWLVTSFTEDGKETGNMNYGRRKLSRCCSFTVAAPFTVWSCPARSVHTPSDCVSTQSSPTRPHRHLCVCLCPAPKQRHAPCPRRISGCRKRVR